MSESKPVRTNPYTLFTLAGTGIVAAIVAVSLISAEGASTVPGVAAPAPVKVTKTETPAGEPTAPTAHKKPTKVESKSCADAAPVSAKRAVGNPKARNAAQKALTFLARTGSQWQGAHNCYGCHVQAVTLEGMIVGKDNQYELDNKAFTGVLDGLLNKPGGARSAGGFKYAHGGTLLQPAKAFGGGALARYDATIDRKLSDDLLETAAQLLEYQRPDGSYDMKYDYPPVSAGDYTGTWLAIRTWKQAYEASGDDKWLAPVQKAEGWLSEESERLMVGGHSQQHLNYALMGLVEAGVGHSEALPSRMVRHILERQNDDGGWGTSKGAASTNLETGQTLYALRQAGMSDNDRAIERGMDYLIKNQSADGGWSNRGSSKAEAMWGVLGLVSLDVLSVRFASLDNGQHVAQTVKIKGMASDNTGTGVSKIELFIDDILVASECGSQLEYAWDTDGIADGKHVLIMAAENTRGEVSRRRIEVFAGNHFLTQTGTRFENGKTVVSLRNIAPKERDNKVKLEVLEIDEKTGKPKKGGLLKTIVTDGSQGAMTFDWDGTTEKGDKAPSGKKYVARISSLDKKGAAVQTEELTFVHAGADEQNANWAQLEGNIDFDDGEAAANAEVELVDGFGNVVAKTRTTTRGNFKFRNVDKGKYKVRMKKSGFKAKEIAVDAAPAAAPAKLDSITATAE